MKKNNKGKIIFLLLMITLIIIALYCVLAKMFTKDLSYTYSDNYFAGGKLLVDAYTSNKNGDKTESKIEILLYSPDGKKVKGVKGIGKTTEEGNATISADLPEDLEEGKYEISVSTKGLLKQKGKKSVYISKNRIQNIVISTDKGIYKPGDTIKYSAMILKKSDDKPVESDNVIVSIYDGNDNRVYTEESKSTEYGIVSGMFSLADEVNSGSYRIEVDTGIEKVEKSVTVNPYITPQFEAKINTDKETYSVGETVNLSIDTKYFFGEPVVAASIKGVIGDEKIDGYTDSNGRFETKYTAKKEGKINASFEITDSSKYLVEESKTFNISNSKIKAELLPENGCIVANSDNVIYLFTKDSNGNPLKTRNVISYNAIKKEVITDESGLGKFILTASDCLSITSDLSYNNGSYYGKNYSSSNSKDNAVKFKVNTKDMMSNEETLDVDVFVSTKKTEYIVTDKMLYEQGDDITVDIKNGKYSNDNQIYVLKNNEVLNISNFNNSKIVLNLGEVSGVIDIIDRNTLDSTGMIQKRTVFVKPKNGLNIKIDGADKEFKPGEEIKLDLSTYTEGKHVDSNLLISILDEAVLNIAENDLSIDNIKLALQDITLSEGISAADLYACVVQNKSDSLLFELLLKQDREYNRISTENESSDEKYDFTLRMVAIIGIIAIGVAAILKRAKDTGEKPIDIIRGIGVLIAGIAVVAEVIVCISDYYLDVSETVLPSICIGIGLYILILRRHKRFLFDVVYKLCILPFIVILVSLGTFEIIYEKLCLDVEFYWIILAEIILYIIIMLITYKMGKIRLFDYLQNTAISIVVIAIFYLFGACLANISGLDPDDLMVPYDLESFIKQILFIVVFAVFDYFVLYRLSMKEKKSYVKDQKLILNINRATLYVILFVVILAIFLDVLSLFTRFASTISSQPQYEKSITNRSAEDFSGASSSSHSWNGSISSIDITSITDDATDTSGAAKRVKPFNGFIDDIIKFESLGIESDSVFEENDIEPIKVKEIENGTIDKSNNSEQQAKVRNVFLESLAFIPDVVTENGKANSKIQLSDNITTWNIQVVGNTKNGEVGYATTNFKVFKEFFVNYTLPTNAVVSDAIKIPVTVYNYTENTKTVSLNVVSNDWSTIGEYTKNIEVAPKSTSMVYVPIEIIKSGNNTLRIECKSDGISDIVEKSFIVKINGIENQNLVASGRISSDYFQDFVFDDKALEGSKKVKVKLYSSDMDIVVDNIENILKLPSGCFEQTSSSLYPDILVLKYLNDNGIDNPELKEKALEYISKGYQKLLTYEVNGEKGGYSLYGYSPAETVITAFGLMEMKELGNVYNIDENVTKDMKEFLYKQQKSDGTFKISSTYIGGASKTDDLSMNAYIVWALSEADTYDERLNKSISYLESKIENASNPYTLALMANAFSNAKSKKTGVVLDKLLSQVATNENNNKYLKSTSYDYYGSFGSNLDIQASALTAIALNKEGKEKTTTNDIINYIIEKRDACGTWGTTQSTILALKAINDVNSNNKIEEQTIKVKLNGEEKSIDIKNNSLSVYELEFDNAKDENHFEINMQKGIISYEVIKEYYETYQNALEKNSKKISIIQDIEPMNGKVNDIITQKIVVENKEADISNGLIKINTLQGCTVNEESLSKLVVENKIEKYEYNYNTINLYVRNFQKGAKIDLDIRYRVNYPIKVTGGIVKAYDYYNPEVCATTLPENLNMEE